MRRSERLYQRLWAGLTLSALLLAPLQAAPPERVVSVNLCTDQLAMLLAAPGQLLSVSYLAADPDSSAMVAEAGAYRLNHAQAEEVALLRPDLVLAGAYSSPGLLSMLRRLGLRVEQFAPEESFADIRSNLARMGALLGREAEAGALIAALDQGLAELAPGDGPRPRVAIYYSAGYAAGNRGLAHEIVTRAGFENIARSLGLGGGGFLPLEALLLARPDLVIRARGHRGHSEAEALLRHPALARLIGPEGPVLTGPEWTCGSLQTLRAAHELRKRAP